MAAHNDRHFKVKQSEVARVSFDDPQHPTEHVFAEVMRVAHANIEWLNHQIDSIGPMKATDFKDLILRTGLLPFEDFRDDNTPSNRLPEYKILAICMENLDLFKGKAIGEFSKDLFMWQRVLTMAATSDITGLANYLYYGLARTLADYSVMECNAVDMLSVHTFKHNPNAKTLPEGDLLTALSQVRASAQDFTETLYHTIPNDFCVLTDGLYLDNQAQQLDSYRALFRLVKPHTSEEYRRSLLQSP